MHSSAMKKSRTQILLSSKNKFRLIAEILILYIILPLIIMEDIIPVPLLLILMLMGLTVFFYLFFDPSFERVNLINWREGKKELRSIFLFFPVAAIIMVALIWIMDPDKLFQLARFNPWLLLMISIFYPVFSVIPQGLAYRAFFFHRYGNIFGGRIPGIIASALFFSYAHILYKNWLVLGLTFIAGLIFAWRYQKSKSLLISIIEHSLYGVWLFACGLGYFFVSSFVD